MARKRKTHATPATTEPDKPLLEISEEEQWRLINETGILHKISEGNDTDVEAREQYSLVDEILDTSLYIIPSCFLLLLMEISLIQNQYGQNPTLQSLVDRMGPGVPMLSVFIFYTTRHKRERKMQAFLFLLSIFTGARLIYLIARGSWLTNMRQCPPLATIWVYTIVQLDLGLAVLNLVVVGLFVWWKGLKKYLV